MTTANSNGELGMATLQFLIRSRNRLRVLCRLCESPATRRELQQELDVARTTARRLTTDLEERGWIYGVDSTYHAVSPAQLVVDSVSGTVAVVDTSARLTAFFDTLPPESLEDFDEFPIKQTLEQSDEIRVTLPSRTAPYEPSKRLEQLLVSTETCRGFAPTFETVFGSSLGKHSTSVWLSEVVIPNSTSEDSVQLLRDLLSPDTRKRVRVRVSAHVPPYALLILDSWLALVGFDEYLRPIVVVSFPADNEPIESWTSSTWKLPFRYRFRWPVSSRYHCRNRIWRRLHPGGGTLVGNPSRHRLAGRRT